MKKREQDLVKTIIDRLKNYDMYEKFFEKIECHLKKQLKREKNKQKIEH